MKSEFNLLSIIPDDTINPLIFFFFFLRNQALKNVQVSFTGRFKSGQLKAILAPFYRKEGPFIGHMVKVDNDKKASH